LLLEVFLWLANENETAAYTLNLVLGWALMWLTGTLFEQAGLDRGVVAPSAVSASASADAAGAPAVLPPPDAPGSLQPYRSSFEKRVRVYVRATLAITGTMMFWLGASMLLEQASEVYYHDTSDKPVPQESSRESRTALHCHECTESTPTRNAVFVLLGLALFVVTDTMAVHAGVEESIQQTAALVADVNAQQQQDLASSSSQAVAASSSSSGAAAASAFLPRVSRSARLLSHPLMKHVRALSSLLGVMMLWEGLWDAAFTPEAEAAGWGRMLVYTFVGLFGLQLTDSLFANSGVVPPFSINKRRTAVQQRLGYQLEEQKILRAGAGGQAHDPDMLAQYDARQQQSHPPQATTVPSFAAPAPQQPLPQRQHQYHPHGTILSASAAHQQQLQNGLSSALSMALEDGIPPSPVLTPPVDHTAALAQSKAPFSALRD
jgi:hypothetical protein